MTAAATEDRYNRVVYVDLPIPLDFHIRARRRPEETPPVPRRRGVAPTTYHCQTCGVEFIPKGLAARSKRVGSKVYSRKFCSRACFSQSLIGKRKASGLPGGTTS